jgi:hypothetical protein
MVVGSDDYQLHIPYRIPKLFVVLDIQEMFAIRSGGRISLNSFW